MSIVQKARARPISVGLQAAVLTAVIVFEILLISYLFVFDRPDLESGSKQVHYFVRRFVLACLTAFVAQIVMIWPSRDALIASWQEPLRRENLRICIAVNVATFGLLVAATIAFSNYVATADHVPLALYGLYLIPLTLAALSILWLVAPLDFWGKLVIDYRFERCLAVLVGLLAVVITYYVQFVWWHLSFATAHLVYWLLLLYEPNVTADFEAVVLGVDGFRVRVDSACSGIEGIVLVTCFLTCFLWGFRHSLNFPTVLWLYPLGIVTIWLLNTVRIATLVSIGAHVAPSVAVNGFHSQAGWITFLAVTVGIMLMATRMPLFFKHANDIERPVQRDTADMVPQLAPFMAFCAASIIVAAAAPFDTELYGLKVLAVGVCLWLFRESYRGLLDGLDAVSIIAGLVVGVAWIATAPAADSAGGVAEWAASQSAIVFVAWLIVRAIGSIVIVPIAEELAFRGVLYRWLISSDLQAVSYSQFSWVALILSSLAFGFIHDRIAAGFVAGVVFALVMLRTGRLSSAIAAHMAANALIVAWAVSAGDWDLI